MKIKIAIEDFFGENIEFREVDASCPFEMFGLRFAAHKNIDYSTRNKWRVTELSTGSGINRGETRIEAIKRAKEMLEKIGEDSVKEVVKKRLRQQKKIKCQPSTKL